MPRFFFDFRQADERVPDTQGIELPNVEQAYLEVFKAGQEMWSELLKQRRDPRHCRFEVRSQDGDLMFTFPLQEVVDSCTDNRTGRKEPGGTDNVVNMRRAFDELHLIQHRAQRSRREFNREIQVTRGILRESHALTQACGAALKRYEEDR